MKIFTSFLLSLVAMIVVSCSDGTSDDTGSKSGGESAETQKLTFYTWVDYAEPGIFDEFSKRTGIEVEVLFYESTEEMLGTFQSDPDRYDVLITDDITVSHLRELSLIRKLNHGKLPHFKNIDPEFRNLDFDVQNAYSVPYMWGSTLIAYRKDKIPNPDKSWSILWDPKFEGRVMMLDEAQDIFGVTLLAAGRSADAEDKEDIDFAKAKVMEQIRDVDVRFDGYSDVLEQLQSGEIWVAMNYSGDVAMVMEDHPEIDFFIPREGALLWLDNFVVSRDSKNSEAAHQFIDFMMEAEVAAANSNYVWYASPNKAAGPLLDKELKDDERLYPTPEVMAKCQFPTPEVQIRREHLLNLAMGEIRKLRRDQDEARQAVELSDVGESLK